MSISPAGNILWFKVLILVCKSTYIHYKLWPNLQKRGKYGHGKKCCTFVDTFLFLWKCTCDHFQTQNKTDPGNPLLPIIQILLLRALHKYSFKKCVRKSYAQSAEVPLMVEKLDCTVDTFCQHEMHIFADNVWKSRYVHFNFEFQRRTLEDWKISFNVKLK